MGTKFVSVVRDGRRYDIPLNKGEPIVADSPVISAGAIVSRGGHKGKVLDTTGDLANVSWEDASISQVPIKELKYEGRVEKMEKGGPGSGVYDRHPKKEPEERGKYTNESSAKEALARHEAEYGKTTYEVAKGKDDMGEYYTWKTKSEPKEEKPSEDVYNRLEHGAMIERLSEPIANSKFNDPKNPDVKEVRNSQNYKGYEIRSYSHQEGEEDSKTYFATVNGRATNPVYEEASDDAKAYVDYLESRKGSK